MEGGEDQSTSGKPNEAAERDRKAADFLAQINAEPATEGMVTVVEQLIKNRTADASKKTDTPPAKK
jgi:hypothetical protein